eukprot:CAMPEP_0170536592 /NCGR_PEP_ID=MMETSP0209-20121228/102228_1 /TAXON_ID=665100 ORGANISM="Litonotus pictus, Strain P1" /NCGR_SAMPLE_ID=MMETSP0209 /ASSEMBLY_ACC=CAM_ASM_000301 /LENGTH=1650 /DNA_ID=CAMNT_0010837967 /DNA_START=120 /DNA_END=5073 /DNA_ORIENTATION=+
MQLDSENEAVLFTVRLTDFGYVGIGFSPSMINTNMIIIEVTSEGVFNIGEYWSEGFTTPTINSNNYIEENAIKTLTITETQKYLYEVTFSRKMKTPITNHEFQFNYDSVIDGCIAWASRQSLSYHGANKISIELRIPSQDIDRIQDILISSYEYYYPIVEDSSSVAAKIDPSTSKILFTVILKTGSVGIDFSTENSNSDTILISKTKDELTGEDKIEVVEGTDPSRIEGIKIVSLAFNKTKVSFERLLNPGTNSSFAIEPTKDLLVSFTAREDDASNSGDSVKESRALISFPSNNAFIIEIPSFEVVDDFALIRATVDQQNETITFTVRFLNWGFLAINLSTTMTNSDIIVIEVPEGFGKVTVSDRWSLGHELPAQDTELGGTNDILSSSILNLSPQDNQAYHIVQFSRKLVTPDKQFDLPLSFGAVNPCSFAWKKEVSQIEYHEGTLNVLLDINSISSQNRKVSFYKLNPLTKISDILSVSINLVDKDVLVFTIVIPEKNKYGAIGFGTSMSNTDMIVIGVNDQEQEQVSDRHSLAHSVPDLDTKPTIGGEDNIIAAHSVKQGNGPYIITFKRKLNTEDNKGNYSDFVVDIAKASHPLIFSWGDFTDNNPEYHSGYSFKFLVLERGQPKIVDSVEDFYTISSNFARINSQIDSADNSIKFKLRLKNWGFVGLSFGPTMFNSDMILIQVNESGGLEISDRWSKAHGPPTRDTDLNGHNDIVDPLITELDGSDRYEITFKRPMVTEDKEIDYQMEFDTMIVGAVAWKEAADLSFHGANYKQIEFSIPEKTASILVVPITDHVELFYSLGRDSPQISAYLNKARDEVTVNVKFTPYKRSFLGIAFGKDLANTDVIIIQVNEDNETYAVSDNWSEVSTEQLPKEDTELIKDGIRGKNNILYTNFSPVGESSIVTFKRKLNTEDPFDYQIVLSEGSNQEKSRKIQDDLYFLSLYHGEGPTDLQTANKTNSFLFIDKNYRASFIDQATALVMDDFADISSSTIESDEENRTIQFVVSEGSNQEKSRKIQDDLYFLSLYHGGGPTDLQTANKTNSFLFIDKNYRVSFIDQVSAFVMDNFADISSSIIESGEENRTIQFVVRMKDWGFVAINFEDTMTNSDMLLIEIDESGVLKVRDTFSQGHRSPVDDTDSSVFDPPGHYDILTQEKKDISEDGFKYEVTISRKFITQDADNKLDYQIMSDSIILGSLAWKLHSALQYHGPSNYIMIEIDIPSTANSIVKIREHKEETLNLVNGFATVSSFVNKKSNKIRFSFILEQTGFIALAFGQNMSNIDMHVIQFTLGNKTSQGVQVSDRWSKTYEVPKEDTELGGTNDIQNLRISYLNPSGKAKITYERLLNTKDQFDYQIHFDTPLSINNEPVNLFSLDIVFVYTIGSPEIVYHGQNKVKTNLTVAEDYKVSFKGGSAQSPIPKAAATSDPFIYAGDFGKLKGEMLSDTESKLKFTIYMKDNGYIGMDFGLNMSGVDIIMAFIGKDEKLRVLDFYSSSPGVPDLDTTLGGRNDIENPQLQIIDNSNLVLLQGVVDESSGYKYLITFERKLNTGDQFDYPIKTVEELRRTDANSSGRQDLSVAWYKGLVMGYHGGNVVQTHIAVSEGSNTVVLGEGYLPGIDETAEDKGGVDTRAKFFKIHGIIQKYAGVS